MNEKPNVKITLTPKQKEVIKKQTGKEVSTLKLEALEGRLAPAIGWN